MVNFRNIHLFITFAFLIINSLCFSTTAQITPDKVKATLILQFCENIQWEKPAQQEFTLGFFSDNNSIYNILKSTKEKIFIQGLPVRITKCSTLEDIKYCKAVYFNKKNPDNYADIFKIVRENNVLLITDNFEDLLFVHINLKDNDDKIAFNINIPNLTLAGLSASQNLLINGGNSVDIQKAYENFEQRIKDSQEKYALTVKQLKQNETLLLEKDKVIKEKEHTIDEKNHLITNKENQIDAYLEEIGKYKQEAILLADQVEKEKELLDSKNKDLIQKDKQLKTIQKNIKDKQQELHFINQEVLRFKRTSDTLLSEIKIKNFELDQQGKLIQGQRNLLVVSLALALAFLITVFTLYRLFKLKRKHNVTLSRKVDERTNELKLSNDRYQSLFNLAPVALLEVDFSALHNYFNSFNFNDISELYSRLKNNKEFYIDCIHKINFLNANKASLDLYEISEASDLPKLYESFYKKDILDKFIYEIGSLLKVNSFHSFETTRLTKHDKIIELIINWLDISHENQAYSRVIVSIIDITHLRNIESELKKHQNELELLVSEQTTDLAAINEELIATNEELFDKNQLINRQNNELKETLEDLKSAQAQLIQSAKMASLGVLTAGVAHEINNPLNFIMGAYEGISSIIDHSQNGHSNDIKALLKALKTGIDRAADIVKSLNQFSRKNDNNDEKCDLHNIIDNALTMMHNRLKNKVKVSKNYTTEEFSIIGNVGNLHQVFINLVSNSNDAIQNDGEIKINTFVQDQYVTIEIQDNGSGIDKENLARITEPFFTTKDPGKGTGLGLSITYSIINEHKGTLSFDSEEGKGTKATIQIPIS